MKKHEVWKRDSTYGEECVIIISGLHHNIYIITALFISFAFYLKEVEEPDTLHTFTLFTTLLHTLIFSYVCQFQNWSSSKEEVLNVLQCHCNR